MIRKQDYRNNINKLSGMKNNLRVGLFAKIIVGKGREDQSWAAAGADHHDTFTQLRCVGTLQVQGGTNGRPVVFGS
jgi:hypothetical protein